MTLPSISGGGASYSPRPITLLARDLDLRVTPPQLTQRGVHNGSPFGMWGLAWSRGTASPSDVVLHLRLREFVAHE